MPATLTPRNKLPPEVWFLMVTSVPLTLARRSLSAPTLKPVSLSTLKVPVVEVLVSARMNWVLVKLFNSCELVAVPWNNGTCEPTRVLSVMPGRMVVNPLMAVCGVNVASLLMIPTMESLT